MKISAQHKTQIESGTSEYVMIDGKQMDRDMLKSAVKKMDGQGDGRLSINDVKGLKWVVLDGNLKGISGARNYTDAEKNTMEWLRAGGAFTSDADEIIRHAIASNASKIGAQRGMK